MSGLIGVLPAGFLRRDEVAARGLVFFVRRALVGGDVTDALGDRAFVDFGGALMRGTGFEVAQHTAAMCPLVALVRMLGTLGGTPHVVRGDGLARGQVLSPAQQFFGAAGGLITGCLFHETTVDPLPRQEWVVPAPRRELDSGMQLPQGLARFNRHVTNPIQRMWAGWLPPFEQAVLLTRTP